jgi:hypothetical protein
MNYGGGGERVSFDIYVKHELCYVKFEVLTVVVMNVAIFWDIATYGLHGAISKKMSCAGLEIHN